MEDDVGLVSTLANDDSTSASTAHPRGRARNAGVSPVYPPYKGCSNIPLQENHVTGVAYRPPTKRNIEHNCMVEIGGRVVPPALQRADFSATST